MEGYFKEINKNKYLMLVTTNESKELIKWYEKMWSKIRDLISSKTKNSDNYDEKYIKILFILDDKLPLNKTIEVQSMIIAVRTVFHDNNKYYPPFFLDECLYKLWIMNNIKMFYYDQTDEWIKRVQYLSLIGIF